jgi:dTDP-4-amino-4,6-dideoxygalactose transaminase
MKITMSAPDITEAEIAAVTQVLTSGTLSIGPRLVEFEAKAAAFVGARYGIGVSSGTAGLHLCLMAENIGENDLVITPSFSFIASANAILYERAVPIFVDADRRTGNIDPTLVAEAAHDLAKGGEAARRWLPRSLRAQASAYHLKALLPVHAFGQPAEMNSLLAVAEQHNLILIEDACEAIGSAYNSRQAGTFGQSAVFAFYPNKQMTTGEGGMIVTDSEERANLFRSLRNQGRDVFDAWLNHTRLGYNYRLDEMSAALGAVQMDRIEELLRKRAQVANWYHARLENIEWIERPFIAPETTRMSWFVYVVRIKAPANRDAVLRKLAAVGIPSRPYFTPIHLQPFYRAKFGYERGNLPVTEMLGQVSLALPFSSVMSQEQVEFVCQHLSAGI